VYNFLDDAYDGVRLACAWRSL